VGIPSLKILSDLQGHYTNLPLDQFEQALNEHRREVLGWIALLNERAIQD